VGRSRLTVSELWLGTMPFGHDADKRRVDRSLSLAREAAANFVDIAAVPYEEFVLFFAGTFDRGPEQLSELPDPRGLRRSLALVSPDRSIREAGRAVSAGGAGAQNIALASDAIVVFSAVCRSAVQACAFSSRTYSGTAVS
jgi:hypothetical protein